MAQYSETSYPYIKEGDTISIKVEVSATTLVSLTYGSQALLTAQSVTTEEIVSFTATASNQELVVSYDVGVSGTLTQTLKHPNYHNLYNNGAGVMRFKDGFNGWTSFNSFSPDAMIKLGNMLYSFKDGALYSHDGNKGEFYGVQNDSVISFRASDVNGVIKVLEYIIIESNAKPTYINIQSNNPYLQQTNLCPQDLVYKEGDYFGSFLFDMLSPNVTGATQQQQYNNALYQGDQMRASYFDIFMIFDNDDDFKLTAVNIGTNISTGHRN